MFAVRESLPKGQPLGGATPSPAISVSNHADVRLAGGDSVDGQGGNSLKPEAHARVRTGNRSNHATGGDRATTPLVGSFLTGHLRGQVASTQ